MTTLDSQPVLVAPRPVRANTAPTSFHHRTLSRNAVVSLADAQDPARTPSASGRENAPSPLPTALPSEALEEFLSILRPSFFPPASPIIRRRPLYTINAVNSAASPVSFHKRSLTQSHSPKADSADPPQDQSADASETRDELDELPVRWYSSATLSSPISRTHTRNPFQRHPSYEVPSFSSASPSPLSAIVSASPTPAPILVPLSPAKIPLPLPTPDEIFAFAAATTTTP